MIQYDEDLRKLFHDIFAVYSSVGAGLNMVKESIVEQDADGEMKLLMPLIEKRLSDLQETFGKLKEKINER